MRIFIPSSRIVANQDVGQYASMNVLLVSGAVFRWPQNNRPLRIWQGHPAKVLNAAGPWKSALPSRSSMKSAIAGAAGPAARPVARDAGTRLQVYVQIARPDHWIKNVFVVPGIAAALAIGPLPTTGVAVLPLLLAAISVCLLASANYTINEFLDAEYDRFHPSKSNRPGAMGLLDGRLVVLQYLLLAACGLAAAAQINRPFTLA